MSLLLPSAEELKQTLAPSLASIQGIADAEVTKIAEVTSELLASLNADVDQLEAKLVSDVALRVDAIVAELAAWRALLDSGINVKVPGLDGPIVIQFAK